MIRSWILLFPAVCAVAAGPDAEISARMQEVLAQDEVPGAVTEIVSRDGVTHLGAFGFSDPAKTKPMRKDSIFWIASMTKPVTAVAVMMLQDEKKLSIDDPLEKYLPEFNGNGVTLRHMLTHTSGMGEATTAELARVKTLAELVPIYAAKPVGFAPGSQWKYCQSGINMLGRVVEVVSGLTLDQFFERRIFKPLGMKDTTFYLSGKQMGRWVVPAAKEETGFSVAAIGILNGLQPTARNRYPAANGGLFSTAADYGKFAQMLLRGGELGGKRYLSAESYKALTTIQTAELRAGFVPGSAWGLGVGIVSEPRGVTSMLKPGAFGHGGAFGTQCWIDPQSGVALILMVQRSNFRNADDTQARLAFQQAAMGVR